MFQGVWSQGVHRTAGFGETIAGEGAGPSEVLPEFGRALICYVIGGFELNEDAG